MVFLSSTAGCYRGKEQRGVGGGGGGEVGELPLIPP